MCICMHSWFFLFFFWGGGKECLKQCEGNATFQHDNTKNKRLNQILITIVIPLTHHTQNESVNGDDIIFPHHVTDSFNQL